MEIVLYVVAGIAGFIIFMMSVASFMNSQKRKNAEKNYDKAYKEYTNKNFPEALIMLAKAFYVAGNWNSVYSKQDASTALKVIELLETILEEFGVMLNFTSDLKKGLESVPQEGGTVSPEITKPVEKFLSKFDYETNENITLIIKQISEKGEEKEDENSDGFELESTEDFTNREFIYRRQGLSTFFTMIFTGIVFVVVANWINTDYKQYGSINYMLHNEFCLFNIAIAGLMLVMFIYSITTYLISKKINHKFVINDKSITFPPKIIFEKIITIPFDKIKSVKEVSDRGYFLRIIIKTDDGEFAFPKANFETRDIFDEVHDLIKYFISKKYLKNIQSISGTSN